MQESRRGPLSSATNVCDGGADTDSALRCAPSSSSRRTLNWNCSCRPSASALESEVISWFLARSANADGDRLPDASGACQDHVLGSNTTAGTMSLRTSCQSRSSASGPASTRGMWPAPGVLGLCSRHLDSPRNEESSRTSPGVLAFGSPLARPAADDHGFPSGRPSRGERRC